MQSFSRLKSLTPRNNKVLDLFLVAAKNIPRQMRCSYTVMILNTFYRIPYIETPNQTFQVDQSWHYPYAEQR